MSTRKEIFAGQAGVKNITLLQSFIRLEGILFFADEKRIPSITPREKDALLLVKYSFIAAIKLKLGLKK